MPEEVTLEPSRVDEKKQPGDQLVRALRCEGPRWRALAESPPDSWRKCRRPGHGGPPGGWELGSMKWTE